MDKVRVWYDHKRACYVSNAPMIAAKMYGITPRLAACLLYESVLKSLNEEFGEGIEFWYEEPNGVKLP